MINHKNIIDETDIGKKKLEQTNVIFQAKNETEMKELIDRKQTSNV